MQYRTTVARLSGVRAARVQACIVAAIKGVRPTVWAYLRIHTREIYTYICRWRLHRGAWCSMTTVTPESLGLSSECTTDRVRGRHRGSVGNFPSWLKGLVVAPQHSSRGSRAPTFRHGNGHNMITRGEPMASCAGLFVRYSFQNMVRSKLLAIFGKFQCKRFESFY